MKCPVCTGVALLMAERQGVEIDYCPQCRGIWLDRGELEKLIDRSAGVRPAGHDAGIRPDPRMDPRLQPTYRRDEHDEHDDHHGARRKRGGLLGELFDF